MKGSDDKNQVEQERAARFTAINRARDAFQCVPSREIERETDCIIARNRAATRTSTDSIDTVE